MADYLVYQDGEQLAYFDSDDITASTDPEERAFDWLAEKPDEDICQMQLFLLNGNGMPLTDYEGEELLARVNRWREKLSFERYAALLAEKSLTEEDLSELARIYKGESDLSIIDHRPRGEVREDSPLAAIAQKLSVAGLVDLGTAYARCETERYKRYSAFLNTEGSAYLLSALNTQS